MKKTIKRLTRFQKEFKRQTRLAIAAAIGFLIAFAWRDYILSLASDFMSNMSKVMPTTSRLISAITLTFIGVLLIFISSKFLE